jgi:hypothetical protein
VTARYGARHMRRDSPLLWTLVVFVAGSLLFGSLRDATEGSSATVTVLVQVGALAAVVALVVVVTRRLR